MIKKSIKTHWRNRKLKFGLTEERIDEEFEISRFDEAFEIDYSEDDEFETWDELELAS